MEGVRLNRFDSKVNVQMNGAKVTVTAIRIQLRNLLRLDHSPHEAIFVRRVGVSSMQAPMLVSQNGPAPRAMQLRQAKLGKGE